MEEEKNTKVVSYKRYIISLICVAFLSIGGTFVITKTIDKKIQKESAVYFPNEDDLGKVNATYEKILDKYVGKVDKKKLVDGAIKGMTDALDDPYSDYLSGSDAESLDQSISGSFEGIGATMSMKNDMPTIAEPPIKDSPAEKAKLQVNDTILKVNGKEIENQSLNEVVSKIRGKKGTDVTLTIKRAEDIFDVKITRDKIPLETVVSKLDEDNKTIAHVNVTNFAENTANEFETAIKDMRKKGAKSFIIDVRQNPGGLLDQVATISSMFLKDDQTIVKFKDKKDNDEELVASKYLDKGFKIKEPTVVLVDKYSASASEILAAALKESANIKVIGTKTFGKGTVQSVEKITAKSNLKLTTSKWLTPKGEWIHKKGLKPSIKADFPDYAYLGLIDKTMAYQEGYEGPMAKNINGMLKGLDYDVDKDSKQFNEKTKLAVIAFQEKQNFEANGIVDKQTASLLEIAINLKISENDNAYKRGITELSK